MAETPVLDFDALTLGDIEDIEEYTGMQIGRVINRLEAGAADPLTMPAKLMTVAVWMVEHAANPRWTLAETRQMPLSGLQAKLEGLKGAVPNRPGASGAGQAAGSES